MGLSQQKEPSLPATDKDINAVSTDIVASELIGIGPVEVPASQEDTAASANAILTSVSNVAESTNLCLESDIVSPEFVQIS